MPNGTTNLVVDEGYAAAARAGFTGLQNCFLGQSDHQAFWDVGIPSSLFIWLNYRKPRSRGRAPAARSPPELHDRAGVPPARPTA